MQTHKLSAFVLFDSLHIHIHKTKPNEQKKRVEKQTHTYEKLLRTSLNVLFYQMPLSVQCDKVKNNALFHSPLFSYLKHSTSIDCIQTGISKQKFHV